MIIEDGGDLQHHQNLIFENYLINLLLGGSLVRSLLHIDTESG